MDKIVAGAAAAGAAGLVVGGPVIASIAATIAAVGKMVNTIDSHTSEQIKEAAQIPFLMTKDDDEKAVLQSYRALPEESKHTVKVLIDTLLKQSEVVSSK